MLAYASLHTKRPTSQSIHEVSYGGYKRIEVEFDEKFGNEPFSIVFPEIIESADDEITHICIGSSDTGNGKIFLIIETVPFIKITKGNSPRIIIMNEPYMPENLNPIAREAYRLWHHKELRVEDLHPKLYEAINDALHNAGLPVIPVTRAGAADIQIKMSDIPSLSEWGNA
jgi:hypothetical protein